MSILSAPHFHNEEAAYEFVESRLWPNGPVCPRCKETDRVSKMGGKSTRIGAYKCYACRKPFTVKIGTIFESSHISMRLWLQAIFLISSSKKGISSNQLHRTLGVTLKTAWFMTHRIREAMRDGDMSPFGVDGGIVEADETFIGNNSKPKPIGGYRHKQKVLSLVDRNTKKARSMVVDKLTSKAITPIIRENLAKEAILITDKARHYNEAGKELKAHKSVDHTGGEFVSFLDPSVYTNTVEGFFSVFKRGMKGTYQHCGHNHLNRYLAEFDFRYNTRSALKYSDEKRADLLLSGVVGKRLTYQTIAQ